MLTDYDVSLLKNEIDRKTKFVEDLFSSDSEYDKTYRKAYRCALDYIGRYIEILNRKY